MKPTHETGPLTQEVVDEMLERYHAWQRGDPDAFRQAVLGEPFDPRLTHETDPRPTRRRLRRRGR